MAKSTTAETRTRVIRAEMTDQDWRALKAIAALNGQTLSEYVTVLLVDASARGRRELGGS